MGYPMSYRRFVMRNNLGGGYGHRKEPPYRWPQEAPAQREGYELLAGDLRRLEQDQRDDAHLKGYAAKVGITEAQVLHVLDIFFGDE